MVDKKKLWKTLALSWGFTLMGLFNIVMLFVFATFIALRLAGPGVVVAMIVPALALALFVFLMGEVLVNFMFNAHKPHPEHDARFIASMRRVTKKTRMWVAPRAWVISIGGVPNAMAYGPGIPGLCAVGVSRELVDMLTDEELDGVIAHEFGHIRCRDTGILAVIGLILSFIDRLRKLLTSPGSLIARSPALYVAGWAVYFIGRAAFYISRFSISQEREIAADALAASYIGNVRPLIGALTKLHAHAKSRAHVEDEKPLLHDLMVAHPGLEERVESLKSLMNTQKEVAS